MTSAILGIAAALSWGVYDFLSRFPSRGVGPIPTVLYVTLFGLVLLTLWVMLDGAAIAIVWPKLWLVAVAGVFFALATLALFAAFARGPMTVVAPIVGAYPALALLFAVVEGARPSAWQWLAVACVLAGVVIAARSGGHHDATGALGKRAMRIVIGLALLAGVCFAIAVTAGQIAAPIFGEIETVWLARMFGLVTIGIIYLAMSPATPLPTRWLPLLALMGALDVTALAALTAAGTLPSPEFATVISSALGAITVLLAWAFLKEPVSRAQLGGIVLIFGGVATLAAL
jgi:drug/metabolite transporter (DMT)-like permease